MNVVEFRKWLDEQIAYYKNLAEASQDQQMKGRADAYERVRLETNALNTNLSWYNRGIELMVFCLLGLLSVAAFVAVIFGLIYMGRLAFGA